MIAAAEGVVAREVEGLAGSDEVKVKLDYFEVFNRDSFAAVRDAPGADKLVVAGAVWVGTTRLIDNILLGWEADPADDE
jgi:pantoate--beta-alanine ligase